MLIKKLELQGFKSFPERTRITFHPGITAIIGPNGTGKSNIVDALLWLLGGLRSRFFKGERSGDVIFNGNTDKAPLGMADVVLALKEEKEELILNHRVFRSGESEYRLNGKLVRLKDIQESLWKRSIAEKEYFVIEQGQIGLFLTSKPADKKLLLEEAAGTAYYKDKKKQAHNKLENSEQNLIRLEDIIAEVSRAKNSLQRQARAAIRYRKLREKIRQLTSLHFLKKLNELKVTREEILQHYENCLSKERNLVSHLKEEEKNLAGERKKLWDMEKSIKKDQESLYSLKSQLSRFEADKDKESKRIEFFVEKKKDTKENLEELKEELHHLEKEISDSEINLKAFKESYKQKHQEARKADQASQLSQEKFESWGKKLGALRGAYLHKLSELTETKNDKVKIEKEMELILRQEERLNSQVSNEQAFLLKEDQKLSRNQEAITQTQKLKKEKKQAAASLQKTVEEIHSSIENLQNKLSEFKDKRDGQIHHLQALEKLEKRERGTDTQQNIPGALGLLADFIETDPEYSLLIDVFWKEEVKATLVHTQDFRKILFEKNLKGNFLLIASQKKENLPSEVRDDPRVVGLLKSNLRPHPKIKDSLSHLHEAAIVKDIESAIELWTRFPSLNYITLQGDLLLSSGLLKLGQQKEGIFTFSQEIKKIKNQIAQLGEKIEPLSVKIKEKIKEKQNLQERMQKESSLLSQLERKIEEIEKESTFDQREREKIETNISLIQNECKILNKDKQALSTKFKAVSLKTQTLEDEEKTLKEKLEREEKEYAAHQEEKEQKRKHFFELKASTELFQEKINNLQAQLKRQKHRKESIEAKMNLLQEEIRRCEEEELQIKETIRSFSKKTKHLEEERKNQENQLIQSETYLQGLKKEQEEIEKKIEQLRKDYEASKEERVKWEISKAEKDRDLVNLEESCWEDLKKTLEEVKKETPEEKKPGAEIEEKLTKTKEELQKFKSVNLMAEEEYTIQKKRYDFLTQQKKDLRESIDTTREAIKKIDQESKSQFLKALTEVNKSFQDVFSLLFKGGTAELKLTDPSHPLESGVEITAQPPGKKVQNLSLLSGGEKSLTSLAFFFALFRYKPTPFCILDEVDAALDEVNLTRFLELMKRIKSQTQFIIITHNFKTMEVADYIYGTTMAEPNITSLISVKLEKKEAG